MASLRLTISISSPDFCRNRPPSEMSASVESIELKPIGEPIESPHHHTVEISIGPGRRGSNMVKIMFGFCLMTMLLGGIFITVVRDWDFGSLGGGVVNTNWGTSVSIDPWDDDNHSDPMTTQVGKI